MTCLKTWLLCALHIFTPPPYTHRKCSTYIFVFVLGHYIALFSVVVFLYWSLCHLPYVYIMLNKKLGKLSEWTKAQTGPMAMLLLKENSKSRAQLFRVCSYLSFVNLFLNMNMPMYSECKFSKTQAICLFNIPHNECIKIAGTSRAFSKYLLMSNKPKLDWYKQ